MSTANRTLDVIVVGAGVAGIYQIKQLTDAGFDALLLEANSDIGGTWFKNRYPGCRFDSESYTYGYSFSRELVNEWHWHERFSGQPENLRYLNFVVDKFGLRPHMRFNAPVEAMHWDEAESCWTLHMQGGETFRARYVVSCVGVLSAPFVPQLDGADRFTGPAFHSFDWPETLTDLKDKRVGVIGTGATGIQIIAELADKVAALTVFQRHPNWSIPLNNSAISEEEMADIRARFDDIVAMCEESQGGFVHLPDRRGYTEVSERERIELWDELYDRPGFALLLANFPETFLEAQPNKALSEYVAARIRQRVNDPVIAEKLIPKDHGFGMKRLPLETNYFEAYNRSNVQLVDLSETPITTVEKDGIRTDAGHHALDVLVYATGFHAITGGLNRLDIQGANGVTLRNKWQHETRTYLGILAHEFPNFLMVAGPQSVSGSTNYPRAIETTVEWVTRLLQHAREQRITRLEATADAEQGWVDTVVKAQERMPFSKVSSWFTGFSPSRGGGFRYNAFWGGGPRYRSYLQQAEESRYAELDLR